MALACGGAPPKPTQRLCADGETTAAWVDRHLAQLGPQGFLDSLRLGAPTVFCEADGDEVRGELVYVGLERLEMDGDEVLRRRLERERGRIPKMDPRFNMWLVEPTAGSTRYRVLLGNREPL